MSIIDRISKLLSFSPSKTASKKEPESHDSLIAELSRPDKNKFSFDVNVTAQNLCLKLRIPIPDKRDELHRVSVENSSRKSKFGQKGNFGKNRRL